MASSDSAIIVEAASKQFRMYGERNQSIKAALMRGRRASYEQFWALRDVSLQIPAGSTYGLIGENGSGKSTLLKLIAQILRPDSGSVRTFGSVAALLELGSGFHPEMTGRENVYLNGSILGMSRSQISRAFDDIVEFAGIGAFIDQPVKNYSSGMYVRLGFSVAINVDPDILLVDEVLAVGDAMFQERCMEKFSDFRRSGKTVVIVSHAMSSMRTLCDHVAWLRNGRLLSAGPAAELVDNYVDDVHIQREDRPVQDSKRWGSGEATIVRTELLGTDGHATSRLYTDDYAVIRVHFHASQPIDRPVFGLALQTVEGVYAWAYHSRDGGFVPDRINGTGSVDLTIPHLHLQAGTYDLDASIVDYTTTHTFDFVRQILRFDVVSGPSHESGGIVALGGQWGNLTLNSTQPTSGSVAS